MIQINLNIKIYNVEEVTEWWIIKLWSFEQLNFMNVCLKHV